MGREGRRFVGTTAGAVGALAALLTPLAPTPAAAAPSPLHVNVSGTDGAGRIEAPALSCGEGGEGAYWHYAYSSSIPADSNAGFSKLPATVRLNIDLHSDEVRFPNNDANPLPAQPNAFLLGDESTASLLNARGTLRMRLATGGGCPGDGGSTMNFDGTINVPQPSLRVDLVRAYWGILGVDYLTRRVSVVYRLTNVGDGPAWPTASASPTWRPASRRRSATPGRRSARPPWAAST